MDVDFQVNLLNRISDSGRLSDAERHLLESQNAKYVRPTFLFACGEVLGAPRQVLSDFACVVELIHTGTLLHDDIIDNAISRRAMESVNAKYGDKIAILAGDSLLARALNVLSTSPSRGKTIARTTETIMAMTKAVALELDLKDSTNKESDILSVIDGKTGALFSLCGYLAGIAGEDDNAADVFATIGIELGRIFQIKDDIDDIDEDTGNNILTLPVYLGKDAAENTIQQSEAAIDAALTFFKASDRRSMLEEAIKKIARI